VGKERWINILSGTDLCAESAKPFTREPVHKKNRSQEKPFTRKTVHKRRGRTHD
jgi:hypothetical protein